MKKGFGTSSFTVIISLSLVLFMLGVTVLIVLNTKKLSIYIKENIGFQVYLKDSITEQDIQLFQKDLAQMPFTKEVKYISKEDAAENLKKDLGEDFISFLGYNPLLSSIDIKLKSDFVNNDSLQKIERGLMEKPFVKEITYQKNLIDKINKNAKIIAMYLLLFGVLLAVVAIALINNTVRLAIYSQRFLIRTMYLVGATKFFIGKPFVIKNIIYGLLASVISCFMVMGLWYLSMQYIPQISSLQTSLMWAFTFGAVVLFGVVISSLSAWISVAYYLRLQSSDLYL